MVSIIVIVYNGEKFLSRCLSALMALEFPKSELEVIVVDNNSTDNTKLIIEQYPVKYFFEQKRSIPVARNRGLKEARGRYVVFIDSDCVADKFLLKNFIDYFNRDSFNVAALSGKMDFSFSKTLWNKFNAYILNPEESQIRNRKVVNFRFPHIVTANAIFKREIFDEVGYFDEDMARGEDFDVSLRILLKGYKLDYVDSAIIYKTNAEGLSKFIYNKFIDGQNIAKQLYKYKNIFRLNLIKESVLMLCLDLADIIDRYKLTAENRVMFFCLNTLVCIAQNLGLWLRMLSGRGSVLPLSKSFLQCNKNLLGLSIDFEGERLSPNINTVPVFFRNKKEIIFIAADREDFYILKDMGAQIWELLIQGKNQDEIIDTISLDYNTDKAIVREDLQALLAELKSEAILVAGASNNV
jgi:glycosyltransferase involved in cell wall biosynthesis